MAERSEEAETRDLKETLAAMYRDHDRLRLHSRDSPVEATEEYVTLDRLYLREIARLECALKRRDLLLPFTQEEMRRTRQRVHRTDR